MEQPRPSPPNPADVPEAGATARRRIVALAVPMSVAQLFAVVIPLVIVGMMGWMGDQALHVRSLYMPLASLFFAVQLAFDVTNQSVAARRTGAGERDMGAAMTSMAVLWAAAGLLLAVAVSLSAPGLADLMGAGAGSRDAFVTFLRLMSLANLTLAWPTLCASTLRGAGRAGSAAVIMLVGNVVEVAALGALGFGTGLGTVAMPAGTALNGIITGAFGMVMVRRAGLLRGRGWRPGTLGALLRTGVPVSLTNTAMFGMSFAFVTTLKPFGPEVVSGFATASTMQSLVIMPGVVLGSAAAIVMNQRLGADPGSGQAPVLRAALRVTLTTYAVLVPVLWLLRVPIGHLTTGNPRIAAQTAHYFEIVGPSYLVLGLVLTALMALQQVGGGLVAVTATLVYVGGSIGAGSYVSHDATGPTPLYTAICAVNASGVLAVAVALAYLRGRDRRRRYAHPGSAQARQLWGAASGTARTD
jgi:Na+-driven multidrug efflux pump